MVELRPYRDRDRDVVVRLWWDSWHSILPGLRHPRGFDDLHARWSTEIARRQRVVVAEEEGAIVGFAAADPEARELTQIFVAPEHKRRGIGQRLFAWAQALMPDGFVLHTLVDNAGSRAFYERHGLVPGDTRINPANGMPVIEYRWTPR
jgi:ribosomal protein S18 acetylase RimI-like enzyme